VYESKPDQKENGQIVRGIVSSDGKGHFLYANVDGNVVRIEDYSKGRSYRLNREWKSVGWVGLAGNEPRLLDLDTFLAFQKSPEAQSSGNVTSLPQRQIAGHACVGYSAANYRHWFDRDKGILVLSEIENDDKSGWHWIARLINYSDQPLSPDYFQVPKDFSVHYGR
jgi:hypothetical protein